MDGWKTPRNGVVTNPKDFAQLKENVALGMIKLQDAINSVEKRLLYREAEVEDREKALYTGEKALMKKKQEVEEREKAIYVDQKLLKMRKLEIDEREKALLAREKLLNEKEEFLKSQQSKEDDSKTKLKLQRKDEHFSNIQKKLEKESELLEIGRMQLNDDIKKHQLIMKACLEDVRQQVKLERKEFLNSTMRHLEAFKLPSCQKMFQTDTVEALIAEAKAIGEECKKYT